MMLYLYGVVAADVEEPPPELIGLEGGPVRLLPSGPIAGIVSPVPGEEYSEEALDSRLQDVAWVGPRGVVHENVLTWFADRGPVIPLQPFSLHHSFDAVRERLEAGREAFDALLQRLAGRREWGIKVWRREGELKKHLEALSPPVHAIAEEMRSATPGHRYLLSRKLAALEVDEVRSASALVAAEMFDALAASAESATRLALPPSAAGERALILHSAFLVAEEGFELFQEKVSAIGARYGRIGFELEFTGPWPPYHFLEA
jgi:hypothetical protein